MAVINWCICVSNGFISCTLLLRSYFECCYRSVMVPQHFWLSSRPYLFYFSALQLLRCLISLSLSLTLAQKRVYGRVNKWEIFRFSCFKTSPNHQTATAMLYSWFEVFARVMSKRLHFGLIWFTDTYPEINSYKRM